MTVVHVDSPDKFSVVEKVPTGGGARTCAVDEKTHKVYVFYYQGPTIKDRRARPLSSFLPCSRRKTCC